MSTVRRLAAKLLRAVIRHAPDESQDWANAMLRELDFIESDWATLLWALGSTTAMFRHGVPRGLKAWFEIVFVQEGEPVLKSIGKHAVGVVSGAVIAAGVLAASAFGLVRLSLFLFPGWDVERVPWAQWLSVIAIPETIFIVAAVALWRKRRSTAAGIVLSAIVLFTHFIVHVATHG
jgi:hypothetical protein